jgi:hypothetical protein
MKFNDHMASTWSTMGGKFTTTKTGFVTFSLPEFIPKNFSEGFHVDDRSESTSTYDMIIGQDLL